MEPAQDVEQGFSPLDEELALLPGSVSPRHQDHLVRLAVWMPFERAAQMLAVLTGVQVSEATIRRETYRAGRAYQAVQTAQAEIAEEPVQPSPVDMLVMSTDGAMVPLVHGQWAEVKTLVIGQVQAPQDGGSGQCRTLSYFSRMADATTFAQQATVETMRRGVLGAQRVGAVMDGAQWIDGFVDLQCPHAQRILDFPHAAQYVSEIGRLAGRVDPEEPSAWLTTQVHILKHEGPQAVLEELRRLCEQAPQDQEMQRKLAYLQKREDRMQYPLYQHQGWPIGSGIVESGNKLVMQARLKGAGMHWEPEHVNPLLALRTAACNDRWDEACQQAHLSRRAHRQQQQYHQALQRARQRCCSLFQRRIISRPQHLPPSLPSESLPAPVTSSSAYSWRRPFLRQPLRAKI